MFLLVTGGSGSGKSEYAENRLLSCSLGEEGERMRLYLATMLPYGQEALERVEKHQLQRRGRGFQTVERYTDLAGLSLAPYREPDLLLECMSNLLANEMFHENGSGDHAVEAVLSGIDVLREKCRHLVVVTNDVFSDGITYDEGTQEYIRKLGQINSRMACLADEVVEVVCSIPICHKK